MTHERNLSWCAFLLKKLPAGTWRLRKGLGQEVALSTLSSSAPHFLNHYLLQQTGAQMAYVPLEVSDSAIKSDLTPFPAGEVFSHTPQEVLAACTQQTFFLETAGKVSQ